MDGSEELNRVWSFRYKKHRIEKGKLQDGKEGKEAVEKGHLPGER